MLPWDLSEHGQYLDLSRNALSKVVLRGVRGVGDVRSVRHGKKYLRSRRVERPSAYSNMEQVNNVPKVGDLAGAVHGRAGILSSRTSPPTPAGNVGTWARHERICW